MAQRHEVGCAGLGRVRQRVKDAAVFADSGIGDHDQRFRRQTLGHRGQRGVALNRRVQIGHFRVFAECHGAAGGGLTPWATIGSNATAGETGASAYLSRARTRDYGLTSADMTAELTDAVTTIETDLEIRFKGWAIPGEDATPCSAYLDLARTICRRAERHVTALLEADADLNREPLRFLNRLSDLLWLLARKENLETLGK